jgi:4-amino-4-deoxy-L-arabinose transferase-like glycosyltransferase
MNKKIFSRDVLLDDYTILISFAFVYLVFHLLFAGQYGYFRDELYYIACSNHLDWGFVDQPPLSILFLKIMRWFFGDSLHAIRFLPALAGACALFLTGMIARILGGGRFAQVLAALGFLMAPVLLGQGRNFSMNSFDVLFWILASFLVILIIKENTQKLWPVFGVVIGLGLLNKYSIGFFCIGLFFGLLLTSQRKQFLSKWFWIGGAIACIIFLPHIIWEIRNKFPSLEFMHNASEHKNAPISPLEFFLGQFREIGFSNAILWLPGLYYFFFHNEGKKYRLLGWMYVAIFTVMITRNMKVYYLSPIYPMLLAGGALYLEMGIKRIGAK